jgi:hypothetical protein
MLTVLTVLAMVVLAVLVLAVLVLATLTPSHRQLVRRAHVHHVVVPSAARAGLPNPAELTNAAQPRTSPATDGLEITIGRALLLLACLTGAAVLSATSMRGIARADDDATSGGSVLGSVSSSVSSSVSGASIR